MTVSPEKIKKYFIVQYFLSCLIDLFLVLLEYSFFQIFPAGVKSKPPNPLILKSLSWSIPTFYSKT